MKKLFMTMGLALGLLTTVAVKPADVSAKTVTSVQKAAKQLNKMEDKAYNQKKKYTVKYTFKNRSEAVKVMKKVDRASAKLRYKQIYNKEKSAVRNSISYDAYTSWVSNKDVYWRGEKKNGKYVYTISIDGSKKRFRSTYRNAGYKIKCGLDVYPYIDEFDSPIEKIFFAVAWFSDHAGYGVSDNVSYEDLWKRRFHDDCDGLARALNNYLELVGIENWGIDAYGEVSNDGHMWNWVKIDGKRYYFDFQHFVFMGLPRDLDVLAKLITEPTSDKLTKYWDILDDFNTWYRENVDAEAEDAINCKERWNTLAKKQQKNFLSLYSRWLETAKYEVTCENYAQASIAPLKPYLEQMAGNGDHNYKTWEYKKANGLLYSPIDDKY